jgi:small-conductance mechanosensitive channel
VIRLRSLVRSTVWAVTWIAWLAAGAAAPAKPASAALAADTPKAPPTAPSRGPDPAATSAAPGAAAPPAAPAHTAPSTAPASTAPAAGLPLPPEQVVNHVSRTITWYRRIVALQQLPVDSDDVVPRERLYQAARASLQLAFDFGHAAGRLATKPTAGSGAGSGDDSQDSQGQGSGIDRAAARMADRIANLQSQLSAIDQQITHASARERATLSAKRGEISAALDLAKEIQNTIGQLQHFEDASDTRTSESSGGLSAQIADLRQSVPELRAAGPGARGTEALTPNPSAGGPGSPSTAAASPGSGAPSATPGGSAVPASPPISAAETFRPESAGVIALFGKWFSLEEARRQLADAMKQTTGLAKDFAGIRDKITQEARALARQDLDALADDPAQLAQSKVKFQQAAVRFKQLSTLLIPLGEQGITLDNARGILQEWRDSLSARTATVARYLALRLGFLLGSVAVVLIISELWRRATFRYLHDSRRRQQFLALRRVAVGLALTFVVIFGLVSEVGSLATYAGLITAGLAVALQNVILAVVAYFFLIGRYGVRVGDRVTLAGVTGRVVEIGLVRIYMMELAGPQMRSSGRMVVLSNAVLFQPTALFKQLPGGDFYWHTITLTLAPNTDVEDAEKRLSEAAQSVYEKYRPAIEQQHAALQRFIDFQTAMPQPEVYARLSTKGLECTVRYPVEPAQAASTDQKMLLAVRQAQSKPPPLQLVDGPVLDTTTG